MVNLFYTRPALNDLKNIYSFIAIDSPTAAKRFIATLKEKIKVLKQYPEIGKPIYTDKFDNLRQILYKSYRIIYHFKNDSIFIITIHHQSRLPENIPSLQHLF
ncbi:type II toxin-antitoxin system RelE/ParE family toxin [Parafilimonas terrae]|uniref:Plasmid stabilization system protein ParE n=1 Tax=Parafilimonas terrae TaxID=1465490 RepID=A0A1I5VPB6_9BACT|nr:type II toxin-antitoxin system RelE/ParE family toxin [Parafilimonas terrae]SFQ09117.1 Plasmid stabilization system protein ParE [Parafilimonas terrae]